MTWQARVGETLDALEIEITLGGPRDSQDRTLEKMKPITSGIRFLSNAFGIMATAAIVVIMLSTVLELVGRNITGASVPYLLEISETGLVIAVFFGLSWSAINGGHVAVTLVADRLSQGTQKVLSIVSWVLALGMSCWFFYASTDRALSATSRGEIRMGIVEWPVYPVRWAIAIGFAMLILACLVNIYMSFKDNRVLTQAADELEV